MRVWRLVVGSHREIDGEGAALFGGRWNSTGTPVVYAATHIALALLEQLVRFSPEELPAQFRAFSIEVPDSEQPEIAPASLAIAGKQGTKTYGDRWAASLRSAALVVPSVIIPAMLAPGGIPTSERNVVLNPRHGSAASWRVAETSFRVDPRLQQAAPKPPAQG